MTDEIFFRHLDKYPTLFPLRSGPSCLQTNLLRLTFMAILLICFLISFAAQVPACFVFGVDNVTTRDASLLNWVLGPQFANRSPFSSPIHICRNIFKYRYGRLRHESHCSNSMANGICKRPSVSSGHRYGDYFGAHLCYLYLP
jgi:hypothetical protein